MTKHNGRYLKDTVKPEVALVALNKDYEDNSGDTNPKRKHLKPKAQLLMTILGIQ